MWNGSPSPEDQGHPWRPAQGARGSLSWQGRPEEESQEQAWRESDGDTICRRELDWPVKPFRAQCHCGGG